MLIPAVPKKFGTGSRKEFNLEDDFNKTWVIIYEF
jgi:hypothetical protein